MKVETSLGIFSALQSVRIFASREDFRPTARQPCRRGGNHERGEKHERQSTKIICVYLCPSVPNFFSCVSFRFFRVFRGSIWLWLRRSKFSASSGFQFFR